MKRALLCVVFAVVCLAGRAQVRGGLDGWRELGTDADGNAVKQRRDTLNRWWELEKRDSDAKSHDAEDRGAEGHDAENQNSESHDAKGRNDAHGHDAEDSDDTHDIDARGDNHAHDHTPDQNHAHDDAHDHADDPPSVLIGELTRAIAAQSGRRVLRSFTGVAPRVGLATQKGLFAEAGVSLDFYKVGYTEASEYASFGYSNLRPYLSGEILIGGKLLGGAKLGVEYIRSTPLVGMAFGGDVSFYTDGPRRAVTLAPRLMLSLGSRVELFWAYNIFLRNELRPWIGHHRVGFSMTLDGRFWRRKRSAYEEYYNSYPQTP